MKLDSGREIIQAANVHLNENIATKQMLLLHKYLKLVVSYVDDVVVMNSLFNGFDERNWRIMDIYMGIIYLTQIKIARNLVDTYLSWYRT
jgi:hypothetical protein